MNESDSGDLSADSVSAEISLSVDEERILQDVIEEYWQVKMENTSRKNACIFFTCVLE